MNPPTRQATIVSDAFKRGCGVLRHSPPPGRYQHTRYSPPDVLARWVEHFWIESWDLRDCAPQPREVLPHPCLHIVFAHNRSRVWGVQLGRFARELKGQDRILGMKFRPGAFHPFLHAPASSITNTSLPLGQLFSEASQIEKEVLDCAAEANMVEVASRFLTIHMPPQDPNVDTVRRLMDLIDKDREITRIEHLTARCGVSERNLQRLFRNYVGAPARWVIKRYRIYEALEHFDTGQRTSWARLAQDLGYYDQAHFINDFRQLVGCSPSEYAGRGFDHDIPPAPTRWHGS